MNNMNFEEFVLQIQNLLRESDSNLDIQVQEVSKNNSIHSHYPSFTYHLHQNDKNLSNRES